MKRLACLALLGLGLPLLAAAGPRHMVQAVDSDGGASGAGLNDGSSMGAARAATRTSSASTMSTTDKINNAMSAAPAAISAGAAIMDWPAKAGTALTSLRQGSNGWTCLPDNPGTPGNDPMCLDKQWMGWLDGYLNKRTPTITATGVAYMLQGGSEASNTDPFAMQPGSGQGWMATPPHIMVLSPQKWDIAVYPSDMGMSSSGPWIMWANTPYEHLMVPFTMPMPAPQTR